MNKLSGWEDTIVALATPPGIGAIGVIRLSGPAAIQIANNLFPSRDLEAQATHTLHVGLIRDEGVAIDEVVVSLFKNPRSYTGEDVVEISCHGSAYVQQQVLQACIRNGARMARAGEFTQRAFLNGKLDLTQAEAVADLIAANSSASQRTALHNVRGGFSEVLKELREQLIRFAALIELELDFSEEDVEFADRAQLYALVESAMNSTRKLIDSFRLGNVIKNGVSVAIIGKPNAGKSTLLNTLLNEERAIVSEIPGTTRDTIEEMLNINGIIFRIIDTAGIREHSADRIENIGIEKSREKMRSADVVLYLFDVNQTTEEELQQVVDEFEREGLRYILAANKADQLAGEAAFDIADIHAISASKGTGIEALKKALYDNTVEQFPSSEDSVVTNARHYESLQKLSSALMDIRSGLDNRISGDLLAPDLRRSLQYISEITGDVTNEDLLDYIFSKFCIGK